MPGTLEHSNMRAGTLGPRGLYVVTHRDPAHTVPHEVAVFAEMILPSCSACEDVRFSLRAHIHPIEESEFFQSSK
jgi:hypothetical protein